MSGVGNYSIDCRHNLVSNIFCNEEDGDDEISITALNNLPTSITDIGFKNVDTYSLCTNSSVLGINCGNYRECESDTLNYENKAICCGAEQGCFYVSATLTINVSRNSVNDKLEDMIDIHCGGSGSCYDTSSGSSTFMINNVNTDGDNSSSNFDIFCDGYWSCYFLHLSGADNVWCLGAVACADATINSMKNVFGFASGSIQYANISNITQNVYCMAYQSCRYATFSDIGGNIYGLAFQSLYEATISNTLGDTITDKIYVIGYQGGDSMQITNVKSIFASGYQVLYDSVISGFRNLYVNGTDSLDRSILTTQLRINVNDTSINSTVRLYIDGTNSNTYLVTCSSGDECIINCLSSTGCTNMILICSDACYLNCGNYSDVNGNDCPSSITGTWYPLSSSAQHQI